MVKESYNVIEWGGGGGGGGVWGLFGLLIKFYASRQGQRY